jgi:hypothetical protein
MIKDRQSLIASSSVIATSIPVPPSGTVTILNKLIPGDVLSSIYISRTGRVPIGKGLTKDSNPQSARLLTNSPFPFRGLDTFPTLLNEIGQVVQASDINSLLSSVRAIENYLGFIVKSAPEDLADRLLNPSTGLVVGVPPNAYSTQGTSGGLRALSPSPNTTPRNPVIVSLGTLIQIAPGFSTHEVAAPSLTLSSAQKSALGISSAITDTGGLSWITGAKLQAPDPTVFANDDPVSWDPAALNGRVEVRIDDSGTVQMYLVPGFLNPTANSVLFSKNPSHLPYLTPGLWFVYILLVRSGYIWS